jgi:serine/threonine-protein kinase
VSVLSAQKLRDSLLGTSLVGEAGVRFHLRTLLGEGGQGWVFKANYDDPEGFWIVVKMLRHAEGGPADALRRFEREAKVLQMLGSVPTPNPNIVRFYDHGVLRVPTPVAEIVLPFIALEYVDGPTLAALIDQHRGQGLPLGRALSLLKQVARALGTVHEHRIVHRDLKPSNILLAISLRGPRRRSPARRSATRHPSNTRWATTAWGRRPTSSPTRRSSSRC